MPLHIDARPGKFSEVVGNKAMIESLQSTIKREDRPHSYLLTGPSGCLRGDTVILDPVDGSKITVRERQRIGKAFHVVSISSAGKLVIAEAQPPVRYPEVVMYRVETSESTFFVTGGHRFLLHNGEYLSLQELIGKHFSEVRLRSISESSLLTHIQDDPHYLKIKADFLNDYHQGFHFYDEQPLFLSRFGSMLSSLRGGVLGRILDYLTSDWLDRIQEHIRIYQLYGHLSTQDFYSQGDSCALALMSSFSEVKHESFLYAHEIDRQVVSEKNLVDTIQKFVYRPVQKVAANRTGIFQVLFCKFLSAFVSSVNSLSFSRAIIYNIAQESKEEYFDFHVPIYNNYWCGGLFHHNCGKTTLARIIARDMGCAEQDISEINMSNNRGIDTAREIIDQMRYKPLGGSVRVFLLDECHKSTPDFQNALLKALEEPPKHVYFLLCTTEPEKLLTTIKNRCATFTVSRLPSDVMGRFLKRTCHINKIIVGDELMAELIREAEGCPRQALVMLEQIRGVENKEEALEALRTSKVEEKQVIDLCRALIAKQAWPEIAKIVKDLAVDDYEKVRRAVLGYCASVLLNKASNQAALIIDCFKDPFYNTGKAGLVAACYEVVSG